MKLPLMRRTAYPAIIVALANPIHGINFSILNSSGRTLAIANAPITRGTPIPREKRNRSVAPTRGDPARPTYTTIPIRTADPKQVMQPVAKVTPTSMLSHGEFTPLLAIRETMGILHTSGARTRAATRNASPKRITPAPMLR